jgi:predicted HicB family RNase H-like nuclease
MSETKVLNVRVAADVKENLAADASSQEASVNDVAVKILADHFAVAFEGTGRRSPGVHTTEGPLLLRVPEDLYAAVHAAAVSRSKTDVVESVLREHYERAAERAAA